MKMMGFFLFFIFFIYSSPSFTVHLKDVNNKGNIIVQRDVHCSSGLWSIGFSAVFRFQDKSLQSSIVSLFQGQLMKMSCLNVHYQFYTQ